MARPPGENFRFLLLAAAILVPLLLLAFSYFESRAGGVFGAHP